MDTTKRCVACAMDLRDEATRCPHCRAFQPGAVTTINCAEWPSVGPSADGAEIPAVANATFRQIAMIPDIGPDLGQVTTTNIANNSAETTKHSTYEHSERNPRIIRIQRQ